MQDRDSPHPLEGNRCLWARELPGREKDHLERMRSLTLAERGEMIRSACRTASLLEQSRMAGGLPPGRRAPWPPSTLDLLRKHARDAQQS